MADRSISYEFRAQFGQFKAQFAAASRGVKDFGNDLTGLNRKGDEMRRGLDEIGGQAGRTGLALGGMFAVIDAKTASFEQSMSFVQAATHETTENMEALREAALEAGKATAFSATEAAGGIEELAKAGIDTTQILNGGLNGALDLAAAGGLDVAAAAEIAATALTQFKLEGEDVPHVADLLAAAAGKAQGSVEDISQALKQSGLVASQMGLSIEETTGTLAAFASAGLLGSDAGTSFRTMLLRLSNPTKESAALMEQLGINAYDANGAFVGMASIAGQLKTAFEGKEQAERDSALATIFGSDAIRAAAVLYEQGAEGIDEWTRKTDDAGYAAETASIRMDNLKGDLEQLGGALETAFIGTGDGQTGILRETIQSITGLVNAYSDLPGPVQTATGAMIGLTALGAGTFWFTAKAITTIANTRDALSRLGIEAGGTRSKLAALNTLKFTAVIAALAALGKGIEAAADARVDTSGLERNLEALSRGEVSEDLRRLGDDVTTLGSSLNKAAEPLQEGVHLFGLLGDTPIDRAKENIEAVDEALANLVESGNASQAAVAFSELLEVIRQGGGSQVDALKLFDDYGTAVDNAAAASDGAAVATTGLGDATSEATPEVAAMTEELSQARKEAYETTNSFVDLTAGIEEGKFSFKDWVAALEASATAIRNFRDNAKDAADKGLDEGLIASLQDLGEDGALQLAYLADASEEEIKRANRAWRSLQRQQGLTADSMVAEIQKVVDAAGTGADAVTQMYRALLDLTGLTGLGKKPKKQPKPSPVGIGGFGFEDGGTIPGPRTPYRDGTLILAAGGEEMITNRNGEADQFRRDRAAGRIPAYASGGTVGPSSEQLMYARSSQASFGAWGAVGRSRVGLSRSDLDDLASTLAAIRPLYGDVYTQPHDYNQFRREMDDDRRRMAIGGVPL